MLCLPAGGTAGAYLLNMPEGSGKLCDSEKPGASKSFPNPHRYLKGTVCLCAVLKGSSLCTNPVRTELGQVTDFIPCASIFAFQTHACMTPSLSCSPILKSLSFSESTLLNIRKGGESYMCSNFGFNPVKCYALVGRLSEISTAYS